MSAVRLAERLRSESPANDNQLRAANNNSFAIVSLNTLGNHWSPEKFNQSI